MKRTISFCLLLLALFSCRQKDKENKYAGLLALPPYKTYTDSIRNEPKKASLYFSRGTMLSAASQFEAALADFEQAWQLEQNDVYGWYYGSTLINLQRYDSAITVLQKAGKQFPASLSIKERLAYTLNLKKKPTEALAV
ncbi:MAG: tetratricopeptide repeat protein, partial [Dinghuibacter sp.]|nr:tetratricopeptide repeat protein [Dinghuibacter sp.]